MKRHPQFLEAWFYLGEIFMDIQQEKKAVIILEKATAFARKEATKHHIKGMIELCHRRVESALTAFTQASTLEKKKRGPLAEAGKVIHVGRSPGGVPGGPRKGIKN